MNFKEQIEHDLNSFFDPEIFGEYHIIDGQEIVIVPDNQLLKIKNEKEYDGIIQADLLYFVKASDIDEPISGEIQNIDGVLYTVLECKNNSGVYEVTLQGCGV
ncbi:MULTISPECIES: hypothetical protein [Clostridium]|uniref:Uncharacterized protein n=1 Tax=Clostridium carnis TaxID=1530 RepID=A0ABY6SRF5_9CLOT|nr:hypothetical protein [Clostridium carnis]CAI3560366.1 conserved hypothetical protein [Clostridium neonatale]CAI3561732.1 conserved hypothetical protein [Clostridium neonatale]CAI3582641.1 conserved hypothetical protein [Clostridium neonatale]CAI3622416.1 conserved hypothetical protein [Clostridium neonatale]CAI3675644.1 conserved hypothetical protein [Clostridium neonatale]